MVLNVALECWLFAVFPLFALIFALIVHCLVRFHAEMAQITARG